MTGVARWQPDKHEDCDMINANMLGAALLWLRNYYDVGDPRRKKEVLDIIDDILNKWNVKGSDIEDFLQMVKK